MINNILLNEEKVNLNKVNDIIKDEIRNSDITIESYNKLKDNNDINTYKNVDESQYITAIKYKNKLLKIKENQYFGRLDLKYEDDEDNVENIYIGKRDLIINNIPYIVSWASPIANVYHKYGIGSFEHKESSSNGRELMIAGEVLEKRKIVIKSNEIKDVIRIGNSNSNEDEVYIKNKINGSDTSKLGEIIDTIQEEQNEIIRQPIERCILVQGCAGSGKSSVVFHRLAYLVYNYNLGENDILVIGPNDIMKGYTKNLFVELGNDFVVNQLTMMQLSEKVLGENFKLFDSYPEIKDEDINVIKTGINFKNLIDNYINYLTDNFISDKDVIVDEFLFIDKNEMRNIWNIQFKGYKINERIPKFKKYIEKNLKNKIKEYISRVEKQYENNIENLKEIISTKMQYNELRKISIEELELRKSRITKTCTFALNKYLKNIKPIDVVESYYELLRSKDLIDKLAEDVMTIGEIDILQANRKNIKLNHIDSIAAMYFFTQIENLKSNYRHIAVDECQDMSYIEISIIESLTKSFTLVGDFNQKVNINKEVVNMDEINEMFNKYTYYDTFYLNKSFRNSKSITDLANDVMGECFINSKYKPIAFNRETEKPIVYKHNSTNGVINTIVKNIKKYIGENDKNNIAIILKDEIEASKFMKVLTEKHNISNINLIDNEQMSYKPGITVLSARLSKGLEFDYVLIPDIDLYTSNEGDRRLLYIAITRALHKVELFTVGGECIIQNINEKLYTKKEKSSNDKMLINLKTIIEQAIVEESGKMPEDIKERLDEIDDIQILTEIIKGISIVDDINQIKDLFMN